MEILSDRKVPPINCFEDLIVELRHVFESDHIDVNYVHDVMSAYKSNPKDWIKFAHFDRHRYTRNLVDSGNGKYNLMLLAWSEGQGSSIHDHADAHCFMKMLSGSLFEARFEWPNHVSRSDGEENDNCEPQEMKTKEEFELKVNDVAYINDSIGLHRVENRSHTLPAVSLHLYCPPFSKCQSFDQRTGHNSQVKVTFFSKHGKRTPFTVKPPQMSMQRICKNELTEYENN